MLLRPYATPVKDYATPVKDYATPVKDYATPVKDYGVGGRGAAAPEESGVGMNRCCCTPAPVNPGD